MKTRIFLAIVLALGFAVGISGPVQAGGSGDFYKTDWCTNFLESRPKAYVTNYDYGTGQQVHYSTETRWPWYPHAIYVEGIKIGGSPNEGYYNWSNKATILDTRHVWRNVVTTQTRACTNTT